MPRSRSQSKPGQTSLSFRGPELAPIDAALAGDGSGRNLQPPHCVSGDGLEARAPELPLHRNALRDRRPLREHPPERGIAPARWEIDEIVFVEISVDEPGQRHEWEVVTIDRMGDE